MDIATLAGLINAANAAKTLAGSAIAARDAAQIKQLEAEFQEKMLGVIAIGSAAFGQVDLLRQEKQAMADEYRSTVEELRKLKDVIAELEKYVRAKTPQGGIALVDPDTVSAPDGPVYLCANCAKAFQVTFLQPANHERVLHCSNGHGDIPFKPARTLQPKVAQQSVDGNGPLGWMKR